MVAFEGAGSPPRQRSPATGNPKYHYDGLHDIGTSSATSAPHTRRRPSRTSSGTKGTPPSASPPRSDDHDESEQRSKQPRNTLKKLLRRDSHHTDTTGSSSQAKQEELDEEGSNVGYMPRLGQIRESKSKVSTRSRRRGSSAVGTPVDPRVLRRRHTGDDAAKRSHARGKHSSLQRHAGNMANMSDPSLVSSVTQQSDASGGSNSTVMQRPYGGYSQVAEYQESEESQSPPASTAMQSITFNNMDAAQAGVFQFLQSEDTPGSPTPTDLQAMPPSTIASSSSSSSGDTQHDDGRSSVAADSQHPDSAMTSPASTRRSLQTASHPPNQEYRSFKKPLYASSFVHGPGDDVEANQEEGSEEESESGSESDEEVNQGNQMPNKQPAVTTPPRAPSTTSHQSDPHARRLKQQERELASHIFQRPQPYGDYQYGAEQHPYGYPPMPMYNQQGYSGASPAPVPAAINSPPAWAPMPSFPAPLAIGYAPHQSPEAVHAHPLSIRPPDGQLQHVPPPFTPHPGQPPLYQQHAPLPNQTRQTVVGYELLANELSGSTPPSSHGRKNLVPMYRKFEHLNHRVLLHLQDETCELEEELRHLDECIAQISPRDASGYAYPASRRGDARYGSEMHFKRTELLGRIYQKLEQYNKALSSFSKLSKSLDPASAEDITAYREWMDEHDPINEEESQFLEEDADLVTLPRKVPSSSSSSSAPPSTAAPTAGQDQSAIWFPLTLVLPLMAFAIVPSLLGRLLVIVLIVGAELKMVTSTPQLRNMLSTREWAAAASV
ncbi:uncharacterized protein J4E87_010294 [Alternaria ethzedia]|uniref:uncharacterized protein n=1 Tax=Alternaria ethzedia TaxID=181014 RepID=UPI0020C32C14|nr:uncharacterized protein J4E87_010294 [Alternaria ethzedia]KAI4612393.1 hypothetical protein J4E87_010294 [Alternaria ethzedia]